MGHDAVGAEIIAPVHDGEPGFDPAVPLPGQALGDDAVGRLRRDDAALVPPAAPALHGVPQKLRELPYLMRSEHDVHHPEGVFELVLHRLLLGHAAAHGDDEVRIFGLVVGQRAHVSVDPLLGVLPDGAGVENDDIRLGGIGGEAVAAVHEPAGVGFVLLAAVGVHQGEAGPVRDGVLYLLAAAALLVQLRGGNLFSLVHGIPRKMLDTLLFIIPF